MGWSGSVAERADPAPMRWWGWGEEAHAHSLPPHALRYLSRELGLALRPSPPVALASVHLDAPALDAEALAELRGVVGERGVLEDRAERVIHAAGKGYPDL